MTGLGIFVPPALDMGTLPGGPPAPPSALPGAQAFLDLLGLLGLTSAEVAGAEAPPAEPSPQAEVVAPVQVAPKQLSDALIRSMLRAPVLPKAQPAVDTFVMPEPLDPLPLETVAVPQPLAREDWDVPFDWIAPEEQEVCREDGCVAAESVLTWDSPPALRPSPMENPALPAPSANVSKVQVQVTVATEARAAVTPERIGLVAESGPASPAPGSAERPAPLAFKLTLTAAETGSSTPELAVVQPLIRSARQAPEADSDPVLANSTASPAVAAPDTGTSESGQDEPRRDEPESAPVLAESVRARPVKLGQRAEPVPLATQPPVPSAPTVMQQPVQAAPRTSPEPIVTPPSQIVSAELVPPALARPNTTHEIAVRVSAPHTSPVDLHVKERGGEVHVAVRTPDGELRSALRQDLGSLVDRLEHSGMQTDAFVPETLLARETGPRTESSLGFDLSSPARAQATEAPGRTGTNDAERDARGSHENGSSGQQQHPQRRRQGEQQKWAMGMLDSGVPHMEEAA